MLPSYSTVYPFIKSLNDLENVSSFIDSLSINYPPVADTRGRISYSPT